MYFLVGNGDRIHQALADQARNEGQEESVEKTQSSRHHCDCDSRPGVGSQVSWSAPVGRPVLGDYCLLQSQRLSGVMRGESGHASAWLPEATSTSRSRGGGTLRGEGTLSYGRARDVL